MQVVVSDNSTDDRTRALVEPLLARWKGPTRYVLNHPGVGAEPNFNRCLELATGQWVHILHDDDYLLRGVGPLLEAIATARSTDRVHLFGVHVVDERERLRKRQAFRTERRLLPADALAHLLTDSSWMRFPAVVVRHDAYDAVGPFDTTVRNPTDFDMWIRLLSRYGVRCLPAVSCAYTVHSGALSAAMFRPETIDTLGGIFDTVVADGLLPEASVRRHQADFLHQFILGATWRCLRTRDLAGARATMRLFRHPVVRRLRRSPRWAPVRVAFEVMTGAALPLAADRQPRHCGARPGAPPGAGRAPRS